MLKINRILCPIDFSEFSVKAYEYAQSLAWYYRATLLLEHVTESLTPMYPYYAFPSAYIDISRELRTHAEQQLRDFAKTHTRGGVLPECSVHDGDVASVILDVADMQAVSLIVMGTHGLRGLTASSSGLLHPSAIGGCEKNLPMGPNPGGFGGSSPY